MEDAFVGNRVHNALCFGKELCSFGFVAAQNCFFNVLDGRAVFGAQRGVRSIELDVLANAFAPGCKSGVLFLGFGSSHI